MPCIVLAHVIEAGIAANLGGCLVLGLVHDLGVIGPGQLGHRHEGSPQGVRGKGGVQIALHNQVQVLIRQPALCEPTVFA